MKAPETDAGCETTGSAKALTVLHGPRGSFSWNCEDGSTLIFQGI